MAAVLLFLLPAVLLLAACGVTLLLMRQRWFEPDALRQVVQFVLSLIGR